MGKNHKRKLDEERARLRKEVEEEFLLKKCISSNHAKIRSEHVVDKTDCPLCLDACKFRSGKGLLLCGSCEQVYHMDCILKVETGTTCPCCRGQMNERWPQFDDSNFRREKNEHQYTKNRCNEFLVRNQFLQRQLETTEQENINCRARFELQSQLVSKLESKITDLECELRQVRAKPSTKTYFLGYFKRKTK